jgi:nitroreductase
MVKFVYLLTPMVMLLSVISSAQNIALPAPDRQGGIPLMKALNERQSTRDFSDKEISLQDISDLCWAAWGYNRDDKRTAPSSMNKQEMDLYVVLKQGAYLYNARKNLLELIKDGDLRKFCGKQDFVAAAPLNFIYVANLKKAGIKTEDAITTEELLPSYNNTGFMAQNVYLVAASKNLGCVVRAWIDSDQLEKTLGLSPLQKVILGQTLGHKKK